MLQHLKRRGGFTFVEVIAVLAILVIISSIIISQSGSFSTDLASQTDILKTHLRHAQALGMTGTDATGVYGIKCDTVFYWLFKGNNPDLNIIALTDDQQYNTGNDGKLNLAEKKIDIANAFTVFFDDRGIPYSSYTDETTNTAYSGDLLINVTPAGKSVPVKTITVTQHTGFIP